MIWVTRKECCKCVPAAVRRGVRSAAGGGLWAAAVGLSVTALLVSLAAGVGSLLWLRILQASQGQLDEERLFSEGEY